VEASLAQETPRDHDDVRGEPCWTQSLVVGSRRFEEQVKPLRLTGREIEIVESGGDQVRALLEAAILCGQKTSPKNGSKTQN
jgi:hypothetical protein